MQSHLACRQLTNLIEKHELCFPRLKNQVLCLSISSALPIGLVSLYKTQSVEHCRYSGLGPGHKYWAWGRLRNANCLSPSPAPAFLKGCCNQKAKAQSKGFDGEFFAFSALRSSICDQPGTQPKGFASFALKRRPPAGMLDEMNALQARMVRTLGALKYRTP